MVSLTLRPRLRLAIQEAIHQIQMVKHRQQLQEQLTPQCPSPEYLLMVGNLQAPHQKLQD
jgi:hypothetical protein